MQKTDSRLFETIHDALLSLAVRSDREFCTVVYFQHADQFRYRIINDQELSVWLRDVSNGTLQHSGVAA